MSAECREAFEAWFVQRYPNMPKYSDDYLLNGGREMEAASWKAWQAAWNTRAPADGGWRPISEYDPSMFKVLIFSKGDIALAFQDTENELAWTLGDGHDYFPAMRRHLQRPTLFRKLPQRPAKKDE